MDISIRIALWTAILTAMGVIVTIVIFLRQSKTQVHYIKAQVSADLTERLNASNESEIGHPEIMEFFETLFQSETLENHTYVLLTDIRMALFEEVFVQYRKFRLMDEEDWIAWREIIKRWISRPFFEGYWRHASPYFRASFVSEVASITSEVAHLHSPKSPTKQPNKS